MSYSYLFKFIVIGDTSVGKSCLLLQFLEKKFKFDHDMTIGVEYGSKTVEVLGKDIKLQIWDTAGQQAFRSITRSYYRGSIGVVLVYDTTNRESFRSCEKWLEETRTFANNKVVTILVGSKIDMEGKRMVSQEEGLQFAKEHGLLFVQCSAKTSQNVDAVFLTLTETILKKIEVKEIDPHNQAIGVKLGNVPVVPEKPIGGCRC